MIDQLVCRNSTLRPGITDEIPPQSPSQDALTPPLPSIAYASLLPIIWQLLAKSPPPSRSASSENSLDIPVSVGSALLSHLSRQGSSSSIKSLGDHFIISLISMHETRHPRLPFFIPPGSPMRELLRVWFEGVPKTLYELGSRDERATERLLRFLLEVGHRGQAALKAPYSLISSEVSRGFVSNVVIDDDYRPFLVPLRDSRHSSTLNTRPKAR